MHGVRGEAACEYTADGVGAGRLGLPAIKRKTKLATMEAGGIMIWHVLGDSPGSKSLLRAINEVSGR